MIAEEVFEYPVINLLSFNSKPVVYSTSEITVGAGIGYLRVTHLVNGSGFLTIDTRKTEGTNEFISIPLSQSQVERLSVDENGGYKLV